jgi:hypothetical protein
MTTTHEESIQDAVARETARRKRVFLTYLGLLLLPLIVGAFALANAPSETEAVAEAVTPVVAQAVGARVAEEVVRQATPMIQENVSREVARNVEPQLKAVADVASELRGSVTTLGGDVEKLKSTVAVTPNPRLLSDLQRRVNEVDASSQGHGRARQELARQIEMLRGDMKENADAQNRALKELNGNLTEIEARVTRLEKWVTALNQRIE